MNFDYGPILRPGEFNITDKAVSMSNLKSGDKALDVGCGSGATVEYLSKKYGLQMTGIDKSETLIEQGKKRNKNLNLMVGDGCRLPFSVNYFDAVLMECSLSLMYNKTEAIHEAFCVLKHGGKLIIHGVYIKCPTEEHMERLAKTKQERAKPQVITGGHCKTDEDFARLDDCMMDGALLLDEVMGKLSDLDFKTILLEDRSDDLKSFAAEIIFNYGSMEKYLKTVMPNEDSSECFCKKIPKSNIGYFLLIAEKP